MKRLALPLLAGPALIAALAATGGSTAAFVDSAQTTGNAGADSIERWIALEPADSATCAPAGSVATGLDRALAVVAGGPAARTTGGLVLSCALVLRARDTFPDGVGSIGVRVAPDGTAGSPITGASLATSAADATAASDTATLLPGQRRIVRMTVRDTDVDEGKLLVTANVGGESTDFLRYDVPVSVCAGATAAGCAGGGATGGIGGDPGDTGNTGNTGGQPDTGTGTTGAGNSTNPGTPQEPGAGNADSQNPPPAKCVSTRRFTIHFPLLRRGEKIRRATVTIAGKRTTVRIASKRRRAAATIDLRGRGEGTVTVKVFVRATSGRLIRQTRSYTTCTPGTTPTPA